MTLALRLSGMSPGVPVRFLATILLLLAASPAQSRNVDPGAEAAVEAAEGIDPAAPPAAPEPEAVAAEPDQDAQPAGAPDSEPADEIGDEAADETGDDPSATGASASPIKVLGEGSVVLYVVDHSPDWSMHADNVPADVLFRLWRGVGGPEVKAKPVLDHPFTMSVHRMSAERVVARILDGFNYTLRYKDGRLAGVQVLSAQPSRMYKTPRLVEPRSKWTETELASLSIGTDKAGAAPAAASPPVAASPPPPALIPPPATPPAAPAAARPARAPSVPPGQPREWPSAQKRMPSTPKAALPTRAGALRKARGATEEPAPAAAEEQPAAEASPPPRQRIPRRGAP